MREPPQMWRSLLSQVGVGPEYVYLQVYLSGLGAQVSVLSSDDPLKFSAGHWTVEELLFLPCPTSPHLLSLGTAGLCPSESSSVPLFPLSSL